MINATQIEGILRQRYPDLEFLGEGVFRGIDRHAERDYAVRYFDLNDELAKAASSLKRYQEGVLSDRYFSPKSATDLRWSHYLYFIASEEQSRRNEFKRLKALVESDREYARKQVVLERELPELLTPSKVLKSSSTVPEDLATTWMKRLDENGLGYVLDDQLTVPEVVRRIAAGHKDKAARAATSIELLPGEKAAASRFLSRLTIQGFRPHPAEKEHALGRVNLITGANGTGKTSLLEAIEYAFCGQNRRAGVVASDTSIVAELVDSGEKLSSTTAPARLRARHSAWYAKTEVKTVTIEHSFGKFNFLDTDAAVNLSVANSTQQIGADVSRLVLGAEAEKLGDRLRRVREKLTDDQKDMERDVRANEKLELSAQTRVSALLEAPKLSDGLFAELVVALQRAGWQQIPLERSGTASVRESLQGAMSSVELLQRSSVDVLRSDESSLQQFWSELDSAARKAVELELGLRTIELELVESQRKGDVLSTRIEILDALSTYAQEGFEGAIAIVDNLQKSVSARTTKLGVLRSASPKGSLLDEYQYDPISTAEAKLLVRLDGARTTLKQAFGNLAEFESTQSELKLLYQRLITTATELIQRSSTPDQCPVCRTGFKEGQLMLRLVAESGTAAMEKQDRLQDEVTRAQMSVVLSQEAMGELQSLTRFLGGASGSTVQEALMMVEQERALLDNESTEFSAAQERFQMLNISGLTKDDLGQKLMQAGLQMLPTVSVLESVRATAVEERQELQGVQQTAQGKLTTTQREVELLAARYSADISVAPGKLAQQIRAQLTSFEAAIEAKQNLLSSVLISSGTTLASLAINLETARDLLVRVVTTEAKETSENQSLTRETEEIEKLKCIVEESKLKIERLHDADVVLTELTNQGSGGQLAHKS